jgi:hypothetical protein
MIARCAHNARTNGPQQAGRTCQQAACSQCPDLQERECPAGSVTVWYAISGTANAVRVHALPGFKSPSLRRAAVCCSLPSRAASRRAAVSVQGATPGTPFGQGFPEITDPGGSPGSAFLGRWAHITSEAVASGSS